MTGFRATLSNMRVDRLVAVLLLLQARGHVTAADVATELEISERTARRDLDALITAGLPVYSIRGRGGGWRLAGGGRTDLTGLTADEARALVLAVGTAAELGTSARAGLRKLQRALPDRLRASAATAAAVTIVDPAGWEGLRPRRPTTPPAHLDAVHRAAVEGMRIVIGYVDRAGSVSEREVDPHAVVNHGGTWYLLADTEHGRRTFRIDRVAAVTATGRPGDRPADYDAERAWREVVEQIDELRSPVEVDARVRDELLAPLRWLLGRRVVEVGEPDDDGWRPCRLRGQRPRSLANELAGFGGGVVVEGPVEVRDELARIARELADVYLP